jgi:hypothetical protein
VDIPGKSVGVHTGHGNTFQMKMNPVTAVLKLWHKSNTISTEQMLFVRHDAVYFGRVTNVKKHTRKKTFTALISLTEVAVFFFFRIFHCRYLHLYLYSLPVYLCHCVNIYSN